MQCCPDSSAPIFRRPALDFVLPAAIAHHLDRVLRLRPGTELLLFDGSGRELTATLKQTGKAASVSLDSVAEVSRETPLDIALVQALATGRQNGLGRPEGGGDGCPDDLIRSPAERSVLRLEGERAARRVEHWQQVAVSAAEQSGAQPDHPASSRSGRSRCGFPNSRRAGAAGSSTRKRERLCRGSAHPMDRSRC